MTSTKNKEGEGEEGTTFLLILMMVLHGFGGRGLSFRDM